MLLKINHYQHYFVYFNKPQTHIHDEYYELNTKHHIYCRYKKISKIQQKNSFLAEVAIDFG